MTASRLAWTLSYATVPLFWPVFLATAALAALLVVRARLPWRSREPFDAAPLLAVAACVAPYLAVLLWGAEFAYHDNDVFTEHIAAGRAWPPAIWPPQGRYFPLYGQEFNALALIAAAPLLFHAFVAAELVILCWLLTALLSDLPAGWRYGAIATLILSNSVGLVHADLLAPERTVVLCMVGLALALSRADRAPSRWNVMAALLAAQGALYSQEPAVVAIAAMALGRLAPAWQRRRQSGRPLVRFVALDAALLGLCAIFAAQFAVSRLPFQPGPHVDRVDFGFLPTLLVYARTDFFLLPFGAALVSRMARVRRLDDLDPVWDPLAAGGLAYLITLLLIGLPGTRHAAPVDVVAALFTTREVVYRIQATRRARPLLVALSSAVAATVILAGGLRLLEYKSIVRGTVELAGFVERHAAEHPGDIRLYFPASPGWRIMNVAAYFHYRGGTLATRVRMAAPRRFPDGRCVGYVLYQCDEATAPAPDDLVVRLPDDIEPASEPAGRVLLQHGIVPAAVAPWLASIAYPQSELYVGGTMPEGWLTVRVSAAH